MLNSDDMNQANAKTFDPCCIWSLTLAAFLADCVICKLYSFIKYVLLILPYFIRQRLL